MNELSEATTAVANFLSWIPTKAQSWCEEGSYSYAEKLANVAHDWVGVYEALVRAECLANPQFSVGISDTALGIQGEPS